MAENDDTAEFKEILQKLDKEQRHTFAVVVHLWTTDPEARKMGLEKLYERLTRKPSERAA